MQLSAIHVLRLQQVGLALHRGPTARVFLDFGLDKARGPQESPAFPALWVVSAEEGLCSQRLRQGLRRRTSRQVRLSNVPIPMPVQVVGNAWLGTWGDCVPDAHRDTTGRRRTVAVSVPLPREGCLLSWFLL